MSKTVTVRRWSRPGADRLVVTEDTGVRVGWVDLRSGEVVVERPVLEASLRRAAQEYLRTDVLELALPVRPRTQDEAMASDFYMPRGEEDWHMPREGEEGHDGSSGEAPAAAPAVVTERGASLAVRLGRLVAEGWLILHDVPVGLQGGVLDHLIIGPGGVFTLREHRHPAAHIEVGPTSVRVDGRGTPYLRDACLEQRRVHQLLTSAAGFAVEARAVIVLAGVSRAELDVLDGVARAELDSEPRPDSALVISRRDIPEVFRRMPQRIAATKVEVIRAAAGRRATWRS